MMEFPVTKEFVAQVVEYLNDLDPNAMADVREDYSGRGMYGKTVVGITVEQDTSDLGDAILMAAVTFYFDDWATEYHGDERTPYVINEFIFEFSCNFKGLKRSDSMGLGMIYY